MAPVTSMLDMRKIRFPTNKVDFDKDYHGWANVNNGRYFMSGDLLGKDGVWHSFASDGTGMIMEIDGKKMHDSYIGIKFADKFSDINIKNICGHSIRKPPPV